MASKADLFSNSIKRPSVVDSVIEHIKMLLIEGKLKPGDLLPSEQTIADNLQIGRGSVREAMKILSALGIVEIKRGDGTFVSSASNKKIVDLQLFPLLVQERDYQSLVEVRSLLEEGIVKLLIRWASDEELEELRDVLDVFEKKLDEDAALEICNQYDLQYHHLMGAYSHNPIVENIYAFITTLFSPTINSKMPGTYAVHSDLQDALEARNEEQSLECIKRHTELWSKHR